MITRVSAVIACIVSALWLGSVPHPVWEPVLSVFTFFAAYLSMEIVEYRNRKKHAEERKYVPDPAWPVTAVHDQSGERVCLRCLRKDHVALPLIRDSVNNVWTCAGCGTHLGQP